LIDKRRHAHILDVDAVEVKEKYQVEISRTENLYESLDINSAWESIRHNIKTSAKENLGYHKLKHNKLWFNDRCSKLIDQVSGDNLQI
jgi:hypothetical protein